MAWFKNTYLLKQLYFFLCYIHQSWIINIGNLTQVFSLYSFQYKEAILIVMGIISEVTDSKVTQHFHKKNGWETSETDSSLLMDGWMDGGISYFEFGDEGENILE